jgi:hypothetical protein
LLADRRTSCYKSRIAPVLARFGSEILAAVLCTGTALRRPSVWFAMRREEGCFSPAVTPARNSSEADWSNLTDRSSASEEFLAGVAGPRALHAPGRTVGQPPAPPAVVESVVGRKGTSGRSHLAVVRCTGTVMRRPSDSSVVRREEGCFSPAVGLRHLNGGSDWGNPAGRGSEPPFKWRSPAGPRAFHAPGRAVERSPGAAARPIVATGGRGSTSLRTA